MTMTSGDLPPDQDGPARRSGDRLPLLLSSLALVTALIAAGVSLVALASDADPVPVAATAVATPTPTFTGVPETLAPETTGPDPAETTDPPVEPTTDPTGGPDPSGNYTVAYQQEPLRLQPTDERYVDLDEPSGNSSFGAMELTYDGKLSFRSVGLAEVRSAAATAGDCVQQLRRAPVDPIFTPSKGQVMCVLTSANQANEQGIRQKVVLMQVNSIGSDGTLNLTLTAWVVPR